MAAATAGAVAGYAVARTRREPAEVWHAAPTRTGHPAADPRDTSTTTPRTEPGVASTVPSAFAAPVLAPVVAAGLLATTAASTAVLDAARPGPAPEQVPEGDPGPDAPSPVPDPEEKPGDEPDREPEDLSERDDRDGPSTRVALLGFYTGLVCVLVAPVLYFSLTRLVFADATAAELTPFVALLLAVPAILVALPRTRRFGLYMLLGLVLTAVVVVLSAAVAVWLLFEAGV